MDKTKVIVCGARGKMGRELVSMIEEGQEWQLVGAVEAPTHPEVGMEISEGLEVTSHLEQVLQKGVVIIDFTTPQATVEHVRVARENKVPYVIGTTGFKHSEIETIKETSSTIPVLISPNMGVGVNLLFALAKQIAEVLRDFDKEIIEVHHNLKKDAPSGTAYRIAQVLAQVEGKDLSQLAVHGREGVTGKRKKGEIGIHSVRGGSVVGDHTVIFAGEDERVEVTHRAGSRRIFARGALLAAKFVAGEKPGLYDLQDVLGIKK